MWRGFLAFGVVLGAFGMAIVISTRLWPSGSVAEDGMGRSYGVVCFLLPAGVFLVLAAAAFALSRRR